MHELRPRRDPDPDKTKPPTRVENLWGVSPGVPLADARPRRAIPNPSATALSSDDAFTHNRAARDCMMAGAYTGAAALLRRLVLHVAVARGNETGTREDAERLFAVAETLLGIGRDQGPSSNS